MEKDLNIPLIATNDSHYIADDDSRAHEMLLCVQTAAVDERSEAVSSSIRTSSTSRPRTRWRGCLPDASACVARDDAVSGALQPEAEQGGESVSGVSVCRRAMTLESYFEQVCREGLQKRLETAVAHLRAQRAAAEDDCGVSGAAGPGDRLHQGDEVSGLLHDRVGLYPVCAGAEYSGGAGPWVGGGIAGGVLHGDHGRRSAAE